MDDGAVAQVGVINIYINRKMLNGKYKSLDRDGSSSQVSVNNITFNE